MPEARRFTSFQTSASREKRVKLIPEYFAASNAEKAAHIFQTAQALLDVVSPGTRLIFPATGMRPLFDAVRGLNEIQRKLPRKNISYPLTNISRRLPTSQADIQRIQKQIKRIPENGRAKYLLIDCVMDGKTRDAIHQALTTINPHIQLQTVGKSEQTSTIQLTNGQTVNIGKGVLKSDMYARPTEKTLQGKLQPSQRTAEYLQYQQLLEKWLNQKRLQQAAKQLGTQLQPAHPNTHNQDRITFHSPIDTATYKNLLQNAIQIGKQHSTPTQTTYPRPLIRHSKITGIFYQKTRSKKPS
jgi:hypothetical protein